MLCILFHYSVILSHQLSTLSSLQPLLNLVCYAPRFMYFCHFVQSCTWVYDLFFLQTLFCFFIYWDTLEVKYRAHHDHDFWFCCQLLHIFLSKLVVKCTSDDHMTWGAVIVEKPKSTKCWSPDCKDTAIIVNSRTCHKVTFSACVNFEYLLNRTGIKRGQSVFIYFSLLFQFAVEIIWMR